MKYYFAVINTTRLGFCASKECTTGDLKAALKAALPEIEKKIPP